MRVVYLLALLIHHRPVLSLAIHSQATGHRQFALGAAYFQATVALGSRTG